MVLFGGLEFVVGLFVALTLARYIGFRPKGLNLILGGALMWILAGASGWLSNALVPATTIVAVWLGFIFSVIAWILLLIGVIIAVLHLLSGKEVKLK